MADRSTASSLALPLIGLSKSVAQPPSNSVALDDRLRARLRQAIEEGGQLKRLGIEPTHLSKLLNGSRDWTLRRLCDLPEDVRVSFVQAWAEEEGLAAGTANLLRALADVVDGQ